jgi:hypothetical protein
VRSSRATGRFRVAPRLVRNERLKEDRTSTPTTLRLDGDHDAVNLKLVNLTVNVLLSSEQVADETLSNAMLAFRRAANILAQEEDQIVFEGFGLGPRADDSKFVVNKVEPQRGLAWLRDGDSLVLTSPSTQAKPLYRRW